MADISIKPEINPEIIGKLGPGKPKLCAAAHSDGSDNRINADAIGDAAAVNASLGVLAAIFQGVKKAFWNRGKTKEDFAAEREASQINRTCGALNVMLQEYQEAQEGVIDPEGLDELIATLEEMQGYHRAGKLKLPVEKALIEISESIAGYTATIARGRGAHPSVPSGTPAADLFGQIREQLIRQRAWGK